jgi:ABC-type nickel/cobalt efflux system permease component RcnA
MDLVAALTGGDGLAPAVVGTAFLSGLRHGFDIDHIAAITDITSSQGSRRRALLLSTIYALGHMAVLLALGTVAVVAGEAIPQALDSLAGRLVGATLIALGGYVVYSLIRFRRDFRMTSRWMLVLAGVRRILHRRRRQQHVVIEHEHEHTSDGHHPHPHDARSLLSSQPSAATLTATQTHSHAHTHVVPLPVDPFTEYGVKTSLLVGMVHGVGAETPTQVLLFTSAAGVAGTIGGVAVLFAFVFGLLVGNTILAVGSTVGFAAGKKLPVIYMALAAATAAVSIFVGVAYLLDRPDLLPTFLGG